MIGGKTVFRKHTSGMILCSISMGVNWHGCQVPSASTKNARFGQVSANSKMENIEFGLLNTRCGQIIF